MGKDRKTEAMENLNKYLESLNKQLQNDEGMAAMYGDFIVYLDLINEKTQELYTRDSDGNLKPFTKDDQEDLLNYYNDALYELDRIQSEIEPGMEELSNITNEINSLLNNDVTTLTGIAADNTKSLAQTLDDGRIMRVDVSGKEFSTVGAQSSSRMAMTVVKNGQETKGFFTKEKKYDLSIKGPELDVALNAMKAQYPGNDEFFNFAADEFAKGNIDPAKIAEAYTELHPEVDFGTANTLFGELREHPSIKSIATELDNMEAQYGDVSGIDVNVGDTISGRNVAMSNVANLLGVSDIIAKSEMMELVDENGNVTKGVFMENAKGIDRSTIMPEQAAKCNEKSGDSASLLKNIADLQMLDYICGNVDRHQDNFFYQFNEDGTQLIGIQGIDNDFSFGKKLGPEPRTSGAAEIPLENIDVISQSMCNKLFLMDESMLKLSLRGTGLGEEEIETAISRVNNVKDKIADKKIEIIPDDDFGKHTLEELTHGKTSHSLFYTVHHQIVAMKDIALENQKHAEEKARKAAENPDKKPFTVEQVAALDSVNKASMARDERITSGFSERIAASQKKIVGSGSPEFRNLETAVAEYDKMLKALGPEPSSRDYMIIQEKQEEIIALSDTYAALKKGKHLNTNGKARYALNKEINTYFKQRSAEFKTALHRKEEIELEEAQAHIKAEAAKLQESQAGREAEFMAGLDDKYAEFVAHPNVNITTNETGFMIKSMTQVLLQSDHFACTQALESIGSQNVVDIAVKLSQANSMSEFMQILDDSARNNGTGIDVNEVDKVRENAEFVYSCIEKDRRDLPERQKKAAEILDNLGYPKPNREELEAKAQTAGIKTKDASGDKHYLENIEKLNKAEKELSLAKYGKMPSRTPRWMQALFQKPGITDEELSILAAGANDPKAMNKVYDMVLDEFAKVDAQEMFREKTIDEYVESYAKEGYIRTLAWDFGTAFSDMKKAIDNGDYHPDMSVLENTKAFAKAIHGNASKISMDIEQYQRPQSMVFDIAGQPEASVKLLGAQGLTAEDKNFGLLQMSVDGASMDPLEDILQAKDLMDITNRFAAPAHEWKDKLTDDFAQFKALPTGSNEQKKMLKTLLDDGAEFMYYNAAKLNAKDFTREKADAYLKADAKDGTVKHMKSAIAEKLSGMTVADMEKAIMRDEVEPKMAQQVRDILGKQLAAEKAVQKTAQKQNVAPQKSNNAGPSL